MKNIWMANRNGVVMLYGLSCVVIGAQKISSKNEREARNLAFLQMILLKIMEDPDHLGRQGKFWYVVFFFSFIYGVLKEIDTSNAHSITYVVG